MDHDITTTMTLLQGGKVGPTSRLHPEAAEMDLQILKRDLKLRRRHRVRNFIRLPYTDIDEITGIRWKAQRTDKDVPAQIAAIAVVAMGHDINCRWAVGPDRLEGLIRDGYRDLRAPRRGFG